MTKPYLLLLLALAVLPLKADDWMSRLPDNAFVAALSIPGAHDACTGSGWSSLEDFGEQFARTQELTLAELWAAGVRAFDLRPCVYSGYLNINHGMIPTKMHFDEAMLLLRDSLTAHPTEFVIIHLLHEKDGDQLESGYEQQLLELFGSDGLKDRLADFKKNLTVGDLRGKMLVLSRDKYAEKPVGGFIENWSHSADFEQQKKGKIVGASGSAILYMQDVFDTHEEGVLDAKITAIRKLLDVSTKIKPTVSTSLRWIINFISAYSLTQSFFGSDVSLSDGYRDNAVHTHAAVIDYMTAHTAGPMGIVMMDYAGTDRSGSYDVLGLELVQTVIDNNFKYVADAGIGTVSTPHRPTTARWTLGGQRVEQPHKGQMTIKRTANGQVRKEITK